MLAAAWEQRVVMLNLPLARALPGQAQQDDAAGDLDATPALGPVLVRAWEVPGEVGGLAWMDGPILALATEQGAQISIYLYDGAGAVLIALHLLPWICPFHVLKIC